MRQQAKHVVMTALIPINEATSQALAIQAYHAFGLQMPAAFTGASISFQVSADGTTFQALYDRLNDIVTVPVAVARSYDLPGEIGDWAFVKIVSASNEAAARELVFIAKS
jgi:hypothetical protein